MKPGESLKAAHDKAERWWDSFPLDGARPSDLRYMISVMSVNDHVDEWAMMQDRTFDLEALLHRLECAPLYADHGVACSTPFEAIHNLEARLARAPGEKAYEKGLARIHAQKSPIQRRLEAA